MKRLSNCVFGLSLLALAGAAPAFGETAARNCATRSLVIDRLAEKYGETRQSIGLGANNAVVEVFASNETGTWTITVTMPNGTTCMIASGQAFEPTHGEEVALNDVDT